MAKHRAELPTDRRLRGGYDPSNNHDRWQAIGVSAVALLSAGLLVAASHSARSEHSSEPIKTHDVDPDAMNDADPVAEGHGSGTERVPATYTVDTKNLTGNKGL